jgi:signal peptidase I
MAGQDPRPRSSPDAVTAPGGLPGVRAQFSAPVGSSPVGSSGLTGPSGLTGTGGLTQSGAPAEFGGGTGFRSAAQPGGAGRRRVAGFWRGALLLIGVTVLLTVGVKSLVVEAFRIPSGSMQDTLQVGDRVLVNKFVYRLRGIHRGDVVVFSGAGSWGPPPPNASGVSAAYRDALQALGLETDGTDYVKRVIGLPGDHVACCDARGLITVNGVPLREGSYLYPGEAPSANSFSIIVPPGRLWVMGDHRDDSADSRYHSNDPGDGTIPESAVVGRVFMVIWPPSQVRSVPIPATFTGRALAAAPAPMIPVGMGVVGTLPLAWVWRRVRGRLPTGRR